MGRFCHGPRFLLHRDVEFRRRRGISEKHRAARGRSGDRRGERHLPVREKKEVRRWTSSSRKFYFGSATSAPQSEGAHDAEHKAQDIWDLWYGLEPYKFHGGVGPADTSTFIEHWREDIALLHETGQNSFRTSISWSRLLPDPEGDPNPEAVEFYRNVFSTLRAEGIEPFVNLFHFDMPVALQERGGWESREVVDLYARYARCAFELFGDVVKRWYTFNEPIVHVECGYLQQYHYPCKVDPKAAVQVAYHTALASALAVRACHEVIPDAKIGIVLNLTPAYPRSDNPADVRAAHIAELFANKSFLDPSVKAYTTPSSSSSSRSTTSCPPSMRTTSPSSATTRSITWA